MGILMTKKRRRYRVAVFLFLCFLMLTPMTAQNEETDTTSLRYHVETPNVLFGEEDAETLIRSVSTVSGDRLLHRPVFQMEQFLDGTLPGLFVNLSQGYPSENAALRMRGRSLLIIVDGIPRADANIPASQIESVSLIKDALGLVGWGMSSGDGVLYIKTKRGNESKLKIDFTAQYASAQQLYRPEFLNAYEYAGLLNKALENDGSTPIYSDRDLELYRTGESPYTHPDVDWYDLLMRETSPIQQYNLNMSGGTQKAKYFIDLNMYDQQGFLKQDKSLNNYDTRENFRKYSLRTNVDVNLTPTTLLQVNIFGQMLRENTPGRTMMGSIYSTMHTTPNNAYPALNPDGTYGGNSYYNNNLYAQSLATGYIMYPKTDFNFDVSLTHHFTNKLDGLYMKALYSYNSTYREQVNKVKGFEVWQYSPIEGMEENDPANYTKILSASSPSKSTGYSRQYRLQYVEGALGYDFTAGRHALDTRMTYWVNEFLLQGGALPMYKYGFNLRSEYSFAKRYMAEVGLSRMRFNFLSPQNRWGFFPAGGLGWIISKEDFFDVKGIDFLKLRTTFGINGNDGTGSFFRSASGNMTSYYYPYLKLYGNGSNVMIGKDNSGMTTLVESHIPYDPECEKSKRFTLGVDMLTLNRSLNVSVEFFNNHHYDGLAIDVTKGYSSLYGGNVAHIENIYVYRQRGVELDLNFNKQFGDLSLEANAHATFYKTKVLNNGEPKYPEPYMQAVGKPYGQIQGYVAEGFFQTTEEIDAYMRNYSLDGYLPEPGDLRYKDLNGDYVIDALDMQGISTTAPRIEYGFYLNAGWKGLSLAMQWTGLANVETTIRDLPFILNSSNSYGQALKEHLDYWRPDNPDASYPRVSAKGNSYNERTSTFWLRDIGFLRLKNVELSYSLPKNWVSPLHISGIKIFTNGYNLLTITPLKDRDPELLRYTSGSLGIVPNFKAYNVGLNVQF